MPFGLCNAPATFQRAMDLILKGVAYNYVIPYLDDIIIYSKSYEDHIEHVREVLRGLHEAGILLD